MKAAVTNAEHGFDVVELPDPTPAPDQLVIRVAACGVCGSDIKAQPFAPPGMVMGHELGGEVVAVGSAVGGWKQDMNAAVLPVISCETCSYCMAGAPSHCAEAQYIGMGPAGGFAEFAVVPARHAFAVPADLPSTFAALVEPYAVGLHGVHSAEISPGDGVLIVGAGGVGLTTVAWALEKGGVRVTVADPDPDRRESALAMGATDVLPDVSEADAGGYDAAIECVGRPELVQACQPALRAAGAACDLRRMRRADPDRANHRAAQGINDPLLGRIPPRRIPRSDRCVRQRRHRPDADGRTDVRAGSAR